jgi:hypothetical protein
VGARLSRPGHVGADREIPAVAGAQADAGGTQAADPAGAVVRAAQGEIGIKEVRENAGPRVDAYNRYTGVKDAPWCASFASFCFYKAGFQQPRTAWSPALFPRERCVEFTPLRLGNSGLAAGRVMGIYYPSKGRIAHCGIVTGIDGDWVFSVEGNTNDDGGNEGDGVYAKKRHRRTIAKYADWIKAPLTRRNVPASSPSIDLPSSSLRGIEAISHSFWLCSVDGPRPRSLVFRVSLKSSLKGSVRLASFRPRNDDETRTKPEEL